MWKDLFQDHILGRGIDYFIRNLVENVYVKDNIIEATVYGTEEYKIEIVKHNEEIRDLSCNCPYADGGNNCKHMAAVLFYLEDKENTLAGQDIGKSIGKLVEEADTIIIKNFLIDMLKDDEKLLNRFKSKLQCDISPTDMKRYKNQVNNIFRRYAGYHDFVDYKNARGFISELEEILDNDIQAMLDNNQLKEAFELTNYIFIKVGNQDMDDSDGGTGEIANNCLDIWQAILYKCDIKLKREIFNWFIAHLDGSVIDYMEDYIEQFIFDNFKEEEFIENKLIFLDNEINEYKKNKDSWLNSFRLGELALRRIEILETKNVNQKKIEEYCKENLEINQVRKYYIDICINKKDYDMAIELLKEGKDKEKDWPGLLLNYSLKLKDLYKQIGKHKLYEEELWSLVLNYNQGNLELYKELKSIYTDKEWLKKREIIFGKLSPYRGIDKLYGLEGLYDRLIELVVNSQGLYMVIEYEEILKDIYPKELLNKYENTIKAMATNTSGRAHYREIVSILRRMKKYPKGKEKVSEIISDWRLRYRNRPAMMDELSKL
ncbi:SWIM zinc finger family protein [Tissierella praeacuta]|uniref:SWIM zinc finger family protein n=1 Tax=Tissierella praeacuta TaxID=43131 RepID=UPI00334158B7